MKQLHIILVCLFQCCILPVWCKQYYGKLIGDFRTQAHGVKGTVYAASKDTFFIKGFSYDGQGPDAFFWAGTTTEPSPEGFIVPDENETKNILGRYNNKDISVKLPDGKNIKDIKWLSVWCRQFAVNFGSLQIPSDLELPESLVLEGIPNFAHGVKSDPVVIKDAKTIYIPNLMYDGAGPDAFFLVGKGDKPHSDGATKVPDEKGSTGVLHGYKGEDITLTLPGDLTFYDIDWFALYCIEFQENFGHVVIPKNLNVPAKVKRAAPVTAGIDFKMNDLKGKYYGKYIGDFKNNAHGVMGKVYAASPNTFYIENFSYDGQGPDAFFWVGTSSDPSPDGTIVPDELGTTNVLGSYDNKGIAITLPEGKTINQVNWLSVWCRKFTVNFGHVMIPNGFQPPKEHPVGAVSQLGHGTRSGTVVIKDIKTLFVPNLYYDGAAPDAFFLVGKGQPNPKGMKVPDENGSLEKLHGYQGKNVTLRLPGDITVFDIDWFGLYCISFEENFGHVNIPGREQLNIPADLQTLKNLNFQFHNCEEIFPGKMQVKWKIEGEDIYIQLEGKIEENEYMGFGRSGDDNKAKMIGADVTLVFYDGEKSMARAVDYLLTSKAQCSKGNGVCPDVKLGGNDNSELVSWEKVNGILKVTYKRPLYTGDTQDQSIPEAGETTVVAAIGPLNSQKEAAFHTHFYSKDTIRIDFGRKPASKCSLLSGGGSDNFDNVKVWPPQTISGVTTFEARIGPTGGDKGYTPITGHQSWGIAWWINDLLIPEITVERGKKYTFIVEGGSDPTNTAEYHPLYITNSDEGGGGQFLDKVGSPEHKIYAGVETDGQGNLKPIGVGRLCEWKHKTIDMSATSETFLDYKKTLELQCKDGKPGKFVWLPDDDTPDLVYYQCFTHRNLGWKIHVTGGKNHAGRQIGNDNGATSSLVHRWLLISVATLLTVVKY